VESRLSQSQLNLSWRLTALGLKLNSSWEQVAHTCNPSYSGGRDQEDHGSKPALANSLRDPISKKPITKKKKAIRMAQCGGPEFRSQYQKKKQNPKLNSYPSPPDTMGWSPLLASLAHPASAPSVLVP
jgi:hypothetical protein